MDFITFNVADTRIRVYLCIDYAQTNQKQEMISALVNDIAETNSLGRVGCDTRRKLRHILHRVVNSRQKMLVYAFNKKVIANIIRDQIRKCNQLLPAKSFHIFVFPSYNTFVKNNMNGATGNSVWKNTLHISINPTARHWKRALRTTLSHEYAHATAGVYAGKISGSRCTLLEGIVAEGIAETFVKQLGLKPLKILSIVKCREIINKIKGKLNSKSAVLYNNIFYGNREYHSWTGYALGYSMASYFVKKHPQLKWPQLIRVKPERVLKEFLVS